MVRGAHLSRLTVTGLAAMLALGAGQGALAQPYQSGYQYGGQYQPAQSPSPTYQGVDYGAIQYTVPVAGSPEAYRQTPYQQNLGPQQGFQQDPRQQAQRYAYDARPLTYRLSVSPRLTYSDNVLLAPEGLEYADGLASVYFSGGALLNRARFIGIVNGGVQVGTYFDPQEINGEATYDRTVVSQDVSAAGTLEIAENLFFLDIAGSARQRAVDETIEFGSGASLAGNQRQADVYSFSASPYLFRRMPNESSVEARYRYVGIAINDGETVEGVDNYLNDSSSHEVIAEYSSGRLFDRVGFSVRAYGSQIAEDGSDVLPEVDYTQASLSGEARYALNRKVSLLATLGYDDINTDGETPFDDDDLSGVFWKIGGAVQPGRRSQASLEVGERYGGTWVDAGASWNYSSRLQFRLAAERRFLTTAQAQAGRFGVLQSETLSYAEELRQLQYLTSRDILDRVLEYNSGLSDLNRQQAGLSRSDAVYVDMIAQAPRTSLIMRTGFDKSDFGFQTIDTYNASALLNHRFSRRFGVHMRGNFQQSFTDLEGGLDACVASLQQDPATAGLSLEVLLILCEQTTGFDTDTSTINAVAGVDYLLFRDINAFAELSRSQRFSDNEEAEYIENAVTVGLTYDF